MATRAELPCMNPLRERHQSPDRLEPVDDVWEQVDEILSIDAHFKFTASSKGNLELGERYAPFAMRV